MHGLRHGPHALGVARLDLEVVGGVQRQLLDLVSQAVSHHWLDHPVVILGVDVCAVVDDVTCDRKASLSSHPGKRGRCQAETAFRRVLLDSVWLTDARTRTRTHTPTPTPTHPPRPLTCNLPVGLGGWLPVDDDGARFVLLAHHSHIFGRGAGN